MPLGWYTLDMDAKTGLLWDPGGNTGFIAQVFKDLNGNNAVLAVTNVRADTNKENNSYLTYAN